MSNPLDLTNLRVEKRTTRFAPVVGRPTSARTPAVRERTPAPLSSIGPSGAGLLSQEAGPVPNNDRLEASLPRLRANADLEAGDHLEGQTVEGHDIDLAREVATASDNAVSFGQSIVANPTLEDNEDVIGAADRAGIAEADEEAVGVTNPATDSGMLRPSESRKRARKTRIRVAPVLTEESDRLSLEADGQEGQQAELPPNPTDVISNLTLTELIDNFEGSLPSKSHLGRSKARSEKQKLRRLRARRDELLSLGISLPSHLQGLPPESGSSDDDEEGTRPPDKRHSSFDRALDRTAGPVAPQLRIVDGQIQIDESSLFVDLHHNAERENGFRGEVEGNSKRHVTSFTYMRRKNHADKWSQQETDVFFEVSLCPPWRVVDLAAGANHPVLPDRLLTVFVVLGDRFYIDRQVLP